MNAPSVRYCTTKDGIRIAYATIGSGPARVWIPGWVRHLALDWDDPEFRADLEYWATHNTMVRYDKRGTGLSERKMDDYSIDARLLDLEAVVDDLKLKTFVLTGVSEGGPVAIAYAARHPERVSQLILMGTFASGAAEGRGEAIEAIANLVEAEWGLGSRAVANVLLPSADADEARRFGKYQRESASGRDAASMIRALSDIDVSSELSNISAPTLVIHGRKDPVIPYALGCALASNIAGAQLFTFEGGHGDPGGHTIRNAIAEFLGLEPSAEDPVGANPPPTIKTPSELTIVVRPAESNTFGSGRYSVVHPLGEGGQKVVYLVHDNVLDRECALSMIRSALLDPEDIERLKREAQAMARLGSHSHIVTVFDFGDEDGTPYLVCEYVPGGDLRRELNSAAGPLPVARALAIASELAEALAAAHARGVIHRDLKPANIWLGHDGRAKLGDFGLAFSIDRSRMTMPGTVMGTAAYLSPEQALGEPVTERSDLYALGCVLYEMVCGRPPFVDTNATAVIAQHLNAQPVAPSTHNAELSATLNDLILRLLAKSPLERPQSAAAVFDELRTITERLRAPVVAAEPEPPEPEATPAEPGFVGRTPEQAQLAAALERAAGGDGALINGGRRTRHR